jgi:halocyanin-like protein
MADRRVSRRAYLGVLAALSSALAGCASTDESTSSTDHTSTQPESSATTQTPESTTEQSGSSGGSGSGRPPRPDFQGWLDGTDAETGTVNRYGTAEVTVTAEEHDGTYRFNPVAVQIDPGATVTWRVETSAPHDISAENGAFQSAVLDEKGATFQHTFEEPGIYRYVCRPHEALGQLGVVVVGRDYPTVLPDGPLAWYADTYESFGNPLVATNTVYAPREEGVTAFTAADGTAQWQIDLDVDPNRLDASEDTLYAGVHAGSLKAFAAADGTERWSKDTETNLSSRPLAATDTVFVGGDRGLVHAFGTAGSRAWQRELEPNYILGLAIEDGALYVAGGVQGRGSLYRLNPETGEVDWRYSTDAVQYTFLTPTLAGETAFVGGARGTVHAVDTTDGSKRWRIETAVGTDGPPVVHDGTVYVRQNEKTIIAVDADTGGIDWEFTADDGLKHDLVATESSVYAADDSTLYEVAAGTGNLRNRTDAERDVYWTAATRGSRAFVGDWGVWALDAAPDSSASRPSLPVTVGGTTFAGDWEQGVFIVE